MAREFVSALKTKQSKKEKTFLLCIHEVLCYPSPLKGDGGYALFLGLLILLAAAQLGFDPINYLQDVLVLGGIDDGIPDESEGGQDKNNGYVCPVLGIDEVLVKGIKFHFVDHIQEVLNIALL